MGLTYTPQMLRRWGPFRQASTRREKEYWEEDFARAVALAPKPPAPARSAPKPESRLSGEEAVFAKLRERFA